MKVGMFKGEAEMTQLGTVEQIFIFFDESSDLLREALDITYLEALAETGENLFQADVLQDVNDSLKQELINRLNQIDKEISNEEIRKAFGLAVLKGMKEATQAHHALTPDAVALFLSYLVNKLMGDKEQFSMLDFAAGTGNLLTAIMNGAKNKVASYAFEVDETLLKLAYVNANLQHLEVSFFHQDALKPFILPSFDLIVSDLPIGYYPNQEIANGYELKSEKGKSLVHYLMVEQAINKVKDGGFIVLLIPNFMFESEEANRLHSYIKKQANIIALLQLPRSMFKKEQNGKSIFILQKKGEGVFRPEQALLAELPSFSRKESLASMIERIDDWFQTELKI